MLKMAKDLIMQLPLNVYLNKKYVVKNIGSGILLVAFLFIIILSERRDILLIKEENYYTFQSLCTILAAASLLVYNFIYPVFLLLKNKPVVVISESGIQFYERRYKSFDTIPWSDIKTFEQIAYTISNGDILSFEELACARVLHLKGARKWCFTTNEQTFYLKTHELDYDLTALKEMITYLISTKH